jgi:hypothetical protein
MIKFAAIMLIAYFCYQYIFGDETGCKEYASRYSCDYVINRASYDIYYWKNLYKNDPADNVYIGSVTGIVACRDSAIYFARAIKETWNSRAYICVLKKDGKSMEKHRYL